MGGGSRDSGDGAIAGGEPAPRRASQKPGRARRGGRSRKARAALPPLRWRGQHGDSIVEEAGEEAGVRRRRVETVLLLDRYHKRKLIDDAAYQAGLRLRADWTTAGRQPHVTARYEQRTSGGGRRGGAVNGAEGFSEGREAAYRRLRRALRAVGPIATEEVIDVCLMDRAAGSEARMEIARRGLAVLAGFYGLGAG